MRLQTRLSFMLTILFFLPVASLVGCGGGGNEGVVNERMKDAGYTPDRIVRELESRLANLGAGPGSSGRQSEDAPGERDPRDPPASAPDTFESIIEQTKANIAKMKEVSPSDEGVMAEVIAAVEASSMDAATKKRVVEALQ